MNWFTVNIYHMMIILKKLEQKFRDDYKKNALRHSIRKVWDPEIQFPVSTGKECMIGVKENSMFARLYLFIIGFWLWIKMILGFYDKREND